MVIGVAVMVWALLATFVLAAWSRTLANDRAVRGVSEAVHAAGLDEPGERLDHAA